jgi:4-hydroxy-tetrahydrodipicolinate synthase
VVRGLHVPLVTPFDEDGAVDLAALERLAGEVLADGADGLVALATTAEASSLDERERDAVVAVCAGVAADRGAALMVGAGTNDTRTTIARHEALGAIEGVTASLAVVPYYVRPSEAAIVAHFLAVAARSPVPMVLYNIPYRTGAGLGAAALLELAGADGIVGVKQAVNGVDADTLELLARAPSRRDRRVGAPVHRPLRGARGGRRRRAHRRGARARRGAAGPRAGAVRGAQPRRPQGDAARRRADRHARGAHAAAGRLAGRARAR